jgi:hypothetical protein
MTTYKRVAGDYIIETLNALDNVSVETHTVEIRGNLDVNGNVTVTGNLTYINVSELNVKDPFILLNSSNTNSYSANAGVLTHITETTFAGIRYNTTSGNWEVSDSTSTTGETGTWTTIATGDVTTPAAGADTEIQFNNSGQFGASSAFTFETANVGGSLVGQVRLSGSQLFENIGASPAAVANSIAVYHNTESGGGTGLYVKSFTTDDELVSKAKAIIYSIIF